MASPKPNTGTASNSSSNATETGPAPDSGLVTPAAAPSAGTALTPRERKLESIRAQNLALEAQLSEVLVKQAEVNSKLKNADNPEALVKRHIKLLHDFNEIRDVAQGLLGMVAENRGVRIQDVMAGMFIPICPPPRDTLGYV